jgi:hypothetical protein
VTVRRQDQTWPPVGNLRGTAIPIRGSSEGRHAFDKVVRPFLAQFEIKCGLLETRTPARRCDCLNVTGERYIQLDYGLLDCFALLDWAGGKSRNASFTVAAFQRVFAEAARTAQHGELYLFFMRRALEIAPRMLSTRGVYQSAFARYWQAILVLSHEGAHALAPESEMRHALESYAMFSASSMMNEMIAGLSGQLGSLLDGEPISSVLQRDLENWSVTRDDLKIGDDAVFATFEAVATDPRFLDEIACDRFAAVSIEAALAELRTTMEPAEFEALAREALVTAYRGFLHLRLLKYLDDLFQELAANLSAEKIDPLKQRQMVEIGFRGNLVMKLILGATRDLVGESAAQRLTTDLAAIQAEHTQRLFEVANELLERTVLNPEFHGQLRTMLAADGFGPNIFDDDPLEAFEEADRLWEVLGSDA